MGGVTSHTDASAMNLHLKLRIQYDGTDFVGSQLQKQGRTVQGELEAALARLAGEPVRVALAGRTDSGVHAWATGGQPRLSR